MERRFNMGGLIANNRKNMIRRKFIYLCDILFALFISSCSNEEIVKEIETEGLQENERSITIGIHIDTKNQSTTTKAGGLTDPPVVGTCTADAGRILIFEADTESGPFLYKTRTIEEESVTFTQRADGWWEGKSSYIPEDNKYYLIYAYAYDSQSFSTNLGTELTVTDRKLRNRGGDLTVDNVAYFAMPSVTSITEGHTQEVFGEYLCKVENGKPQTGTIIGSEKRNLSGTLLRQTGRLEISLTDLPDDVTKASMVIEDYYSKVPIRSYHTETGLNEPFQTDYMITVATKAVTNKSVTLTADLFRTDNSYVYVELETAGGKTRYPVRCADMEEAPTIADAIVETLVKDYKITVPSNWYLQLSGNYNDLNKSNLTIKTAWGDDYVFDGGYLVTGN